jgi:hypothetical protein
VPWCTPEAYIDARAEAASDRVAELVHEIRADAAASNYAWSEVQRLSQAHADVS